MGHIYGTKWALVFGKLVPFFAKSWVEVGRSRDFCYYAFIMLFLSISINISGAAVFKNVVAVDTQALTGIAAI